MEKRNGLSSRGWNNATGPVLLTFRIRVLCEHGPEEGSSSQTLLLSLLLIAKCQVELEGTDRLSGPGESPPIAPGSTCTALPELLLAAGHCPCVWCLPVDGRLRAMEGAQCSGKCAAAHGRPCSL